jgi:hypothetical protein
MFLFDSATATVKKCKCKKEKRKMCSKKTWQSHEPFFGLLEVVIMSSVLVTFKIP